MDDGEGSDAVVALEDFIKDDDSESVWSELTKQFILQSIYS